MEIAPNARRSLEEQLLAIQARLQPAHRMLRRLQRVGAQVLAALWPGEVIPRTPSRTADWLEVAAGRFEAWKASAARSGARRALEFVKAWYPELSLDQLATWRQEADTELEPARPAIIHVPRRSPTTPTPAPLLLRWMITALPSRRSGSG